MIEEHGLRVEALPTSWTNYLDRGWIRRALVWGHQVQGDAATALQLSQTRGSGPLVPPPPALLDVSLLAKARVVEWRGTLGTYSKEMVRAGATAYMLRSPHGPRYADPAWPAGVEAYSPGPQYHLVSASLTPDAGEKARSLVAYLPEGRAAAA